MIISRGTISTRIYKVESSILYIARYSQPKKLITGLSLYLQKLGSLMPAEIWGNIKMWGRSRSRLLAGIVFRLISSWVAQYFVGVIFITGQIFGVLSRGGQLEVVYSRGLTE